MKYFLPLLLLLLAGTSTLYAQTELLATVKDSSGQSLTGANIIVLHAKDSLLAEFAIADRQGRVRIQNLAAGEYLIRCTFLGYQRPDENILIESADQLLDMGDLVMYPESYFLEMASVTGRRIPIRMRGDTMVYDAASFSVREGAAVEDLLRRLPGLSVNPAGQIEYQGRPVMEVMIDGQPFFANNPTLLTRELPATAVDEVAVYDQQSDAEAVSGQSDGQEYLTIDLALSDDFKAEWFGRLRVGAGTEERYRADGNLFRIGRKNRIGLVARSNNLNEIDDPLSAFDRSLQYRVGRQGQGMPTGQNRSLGAGGQYGSSLGKYGRISISGSLTDRKQELLSQRLEQYNGNFQPDQISVLDTAVNQPVVAAAMLDYRYRRDSSLRWRLELDYRPQQINSFNNRSTEASLENAPWYSFGRQDEQSRRIDRLDGNFNYVRRLGARGRVLDLSSNWNWLVDKENWDGRWTNRLNCPAETCGSANSPFQLNAFNSRFSEWEQATDLRFVQPLNRRWNLEVAAEFSAAQGQAKTLETNAENGVETLQILDRNRWAAGPQANLQYRWGDNRLSLGLGYRKARHFIDVAANERQDFNYWTPEFQLRIHKNRFNYFGSGSVNPNWPRLDAILPLGRPAANGRVQLPNLELRPELRHQFRQTFGYSDHFRELNFFLTVVGAYVDDALASSLDQQDGVLINQQINASHAWDYNWTLGSNIGLPFLFDRIQLNYGQFKRDGRAFQLGEWARLQAATREFSATLVMDWQDSGFAEFGFSHQRQENQFGTERAPIVFNRLRLRSQVERQISPRIELGGKLIFDRYRSSATAEDWLNQSEVWLQWKIWSKREHQLRFLVGDVMNQNELVNRQNTSFALIEDRTNSLGRYGLLSLNIKF